MPSVKELQDEELKLLDKGRAVKEKVENEKREPTNAEFEEMTKLVNQADTLRTQWEKQKKNEATLDRLNNRDLDRVRELDREQHSENAGKMEWKGAANTEESTRVVHLSGKYGTDDYNSAYRSMLRGDNSFMRRSGATNDIRTELEERGGYFVMPQRMAGQVIKNLDDQVFLQKYATVFTVNDARSLGITCRKSKANTFEWSEELGEPTDEQSLKWGKRALTPQYLVGSVRISRDFLFYVQNGEQRVLTEIAIDAGEKIEQAGLYGTGVQQPLGLMVPHTDGISTSRDIRSNAVNTFTWDTLIEMKYSMKPQYIDSPSVVFMMHRKFIKGLALSKDSEGQYLWQPSRQQGEPDRILGIRYLMSEWMPQDVGASKYFALLGDLAWYWFAHAINEMQMQKLIETRARQNQNEYIFRTKMDGAPMKEEAFIRGQFAAA